jgi:hypothetical protein
LPDPGLKPGPLSLWQRLEGLPPVGMGEPRPVAAAGDPGDKQARVMWEQLTALKIDEPARSVD